MNVLLIKISSLGDILHTLPALSDARAAIPDIKVDWVVEQSFREVPAWHPAVRRVIPVATRDWRWWQVPGAIKDTRKQLRKQDYERVIDAQGLMKSAIAARLARGTRYGLDRDSAREPLAALAYQQKIAIDPQAHAVLRNRALFAASLGYDLPDTPADYGLDHSKLPESGEFHDRTLVFMTGTTWPTKLWPDLFWQRLVHGANAAGYQVLLPWGNDIEHARVSKLKGDRLQVLQQRPSLSELAALLKTVRAVVSVDSGLSHLAAALGTPCVTIYGATDPARTGTLGKHQVHVTANYPCAPCLSRRCTYRGPAPVQPACYATLPAQSVWSTLTTLLKNTDTP